ncbi:hypothetical protein SAMN04488134_10345 [Amphibacillus marinus]|uniref:Uncharacterized protein n=1 Tax=Amphibacillus marinus TaxID=872970 RepID=A0A1H8L1F5_9BACI|nr:hypothetical protein [Amphibacillus marinus]SEN98965.1 hypothetical protein SAMN04488134_10345 [Amphibacillus marinus]
MSEAFDEELLAYHWSETLALTTEIEQGIYDLVLAESADYLDTYSYLKDNFEAQLEAYKWLENLTTETDEEERVLNEAIEYWEDDYLMIKYQFEEDMGIVYY